MLITISRRRQQLDTIAADKAFGAAFSSIDPTIDDKTMPTTKQAHPNPQVESNHSRVEGDEDQQDQLHLQMLQVNQDGDSNDEGGEIDGEEEDVGFENADMYGVTKLLENLHDSENLVEEEEEEEDGLVSSDKVINKLKHGCVAKKLLRAYTASLSLFLIYIYKYDKYLLHRSWIKSIKTFTYGIEDKRKKMKSMKKNYIGIIKRHRRELSSD